MISVLRMLLRIDQPRVSPAQAIEIARIAAKRQQKPWDEPVKVAHRLREYVIWTNANQIGGNLNIYVDIHSGEVKSIRGPSPR